MFFKLGTRHLPAVSLAVIAGYRHGRSLECLKERSWQHVVMAFILHRTRLVILVLYNLWRKRLHRGMGWLLHGKLLSVFKRYLRQHLARRSFTLVFSILHCWREVSIPCGTLLDECGITLLLHAELLCVNNVPPVAFNSCTCNFGHTNSVLRLR